MQQADSIVVDPHKHGLQPYGCGCILFKNLGIGRYYKHDSPYTDFSNRYSLETVLAGLVNIMLLKLVDYFVEPLLIVESCQGYVKKVVKIIAGSHVQRQRQRPVLKKIVEC